MARYYHNGERYLVNSALHQSLTECLHDEQLHLVQRKRGLLGNLGEGDVSLRGLSSEGHLHQTQQTHLHTPTLET